MPAKRRANGNGRPGKAVVARTPDPVVVFDRERRLRLDFNAICALDDLGINVLDPATLKKQLRPNQVRAILWAALLADDPDLKLKTVGSWLNLSNLPETLERVTEAVHKAYDVPLASG